MSEPIVSIEDIKEKARKAFDAGIPITKCPFPWHSDARRTWRDEYKRLNEAGIPPPTLPVLQSDEHRF